MKKTAKILIADDDPAILDAMKLMLELEEYHVETVIGGEEISKLSKDLPDLILLDIWMSGYDGREICKHLKDDPKTKNIPVLLISASRDLEKSVAISGADDAIAKPFEMEELLKKVQLHLKK